MKLKLFAALILVSLATACGNQSIIDLSRQSENQNKGSRISVVESKPNYPVERPIRFVFDVSTLSDEVKFQVSGYMKCCKSPLELSYKRLGDQLIVDVKEFWSPGVYVIDVKSKTNDLEPGSALSVEVQAK
jgi:hypothetical protein